MELTTAERVYLLRKRAGLSQEAFGELVKMSESQVCRLERGHMDLKESRVEVIALALGFEDIRAFHNWPAIPLPTEPLQDDPEETQG